MSVIIFLKENRFLKRKQDQVKCRVTFRLDKNVFLLSFVLIKINENKLGLAKSYLTSYTVLFRQVYYVTPGRSEQRVL